MFQEASVLSPKASNWLGEAPHTMEGNLIDSKSAELNESHVLKIPWPQHLDLCLTKPPGAAAQTETQNADRHGAHIQCLPEEEFLGAEQGFEGSPACRERAFTGTPCRPWWPPQCHPRWPLSLPQFPKVQNRDWCLERPKGAEISRPPKSPNVPSLKQHQVYVLLPGPRRPEERCALPFCCFSSPKSGERQSPRTLGQRPLSLIEWNVISRRHRWRWRRCCVAYYLT